MPDSDDGALDDGGCGERPRRGPSGAACANERAALRQRNSTSQANCPLAARRSSVGVGFLDSAKVRKFFVKFQQINKLAKFANILAKI